MLSLRQVIRDWGFTSHPFEAYTAENEPRLSEYFVAPPYLDDMIGSASSMTPAIVFGSRGVGKSAIRIHIENICSTEGVEDRVGGRSLAITYDDFSKATDGGVENVSLEKHLEAILGKAVTAALTVITIKVGELDKIDETIIRENFPDLDVPRFSSLVKRHFSSMSELQKEKSFRGIYNYFQKESLSITDRINWFQRLWGNIRVPLLDVANIIQAVRGRDQIQPTSMEGDAKPSSRDAESLLNDLHVISTVAEQIGYDGWYVLIDKVDEDEHTDSDATKSARLISPLLKNLRVLEVRRIGFKFFLWDKLRPILTEERVRLDKVRNWEMGWTDGELKLMIDKRLSAYSNGSVKSLFDIVDDTANDIYDRIIYYSMYSPREIAHVLDSISREHARHSDETTGKLINSNSINLGLDDYCRRRIRDIYPPNITNSLIRLPSTMFTSNDVQKIFRISRQAASVRINRWVDDGYIERTIDTRSENDPSKSMYQYVFLDKRFERVIQYELEEITTDDTSDDEVCGDNI